MQSRSKLDRFLWSLQQLMKIDAMNLVILVIFVLIGWSLISDNIANPARYLPSPIAVALSSVDMLVKGHFDRGASEIERRITDQQLAWIEQLEADGRVDQHFNYRFFSSGDSRDPEMSGIWSATMGSFYMLLVTLALSFPLGVATAIYLEEFAAKNKWTDIVEVNINNLAAVPSIVFGLLGLAVFINFFGLPRSAPLVGGLVLTLMTLPVIIIAARAALTSVPPSIREAALAVGA